MKAVLGPLGPLTLANLPSPLTRRWTAFRKTEVVMAIHGGLLTEEEACSRYGVSGEELYSWRRDMARGGVLALRTTRQKDHRL
jgi:transposase-like protein